MKVQPGMQGNQMLQQQLQEQEGSAGFQLSEMMSTINFPLADWYVYILFSCGLLVVQCFVRCYRRCCRFETDTQQFMLPVTIPLIIAYVAAINVINNPRGKCCVLVSIIPFTSPIVMMVRIPRYLLPDFIVYGVVDSWFLFTTWFLGKIYRTGIWCMGKSQLAARCGSGLPSQLIWCKNFFVKNWIVFLWRI